MKGIVIKNDLFNIANRLKQINKKYFIVYNKQTKKFEVHFKRNFHTLELVLPFERLDIRTINYVLKTKIENKKALLEEIENHNKKLEEQNNRKIKNDVINKILKTQEVNK